LECVADTVGLIVFVLTKLDGIPVSVRVFVTDCVILPECDKLTVLDGVSLNEVEGCIVFVSETTEELVSVKYILNDINGVCVDAPEYVLIEGVSRGVRVRVTRADCVEEGICEVDTSVLVVGDKLPVYVGVNVLCGASVVVNDSIPVCECVCIELRVIVFVIVYEYVTDVVIDKVAVFVDDGESVGLTVIDPVGLFVCVAILDINPEILGEVDSVVYQLAVLILEGVSIAERV